jgi:hypothetical protein
VIASDVDTTVAPVGDEGPEVAQPSVDLERLHAHLYAFNEAGPVPTDQGFEPEAPPPAVAPPSARSAPTPPAALPRKRHRPVNRNPAPRPAPSPKISAALRREIYGPPYQAPRWAGRARPAGTVRHRRAPVPPVHRRPVGPPAQPALPASHATKVRRIQLFFLAVLFVVAAFALGSLYGS